MAKEAHKITAGNQNIVDQPVPLMHYGYRFSECKFFKVNKDEGNPFPRLYSNACYNTPQINFRGCHTIDTRQIIICGTS